MTPHQASMQQKVVQTQQQLQQRRLASSPPNAFLRNDGESREPSKGVYARVDSIEREDREGTDVTVFFDAVDAGWFAGTAGTVGPIRVEAAQAMPLSVLEVAFDIESSPKLPELTPGNWFEVDLDVDRFDVPLKSYGNLFGTPIELTGNFKTVAAELRARLDEAFSLKDVPDAEPDKVRDILEKGRHVSFLNVLDVGQGNAIGLWAQGRGAQIYFDFGGGVLGNSRTFPKANMTMCMAESPPVVLSHWDWDHWSSALRSPDQAFECDWLVPRQALGAIHRAFACELIKRGRLNVWPAHRPSITAGPITVEKCRGSDQNNSGLAMVVTTSRRFWRRKAVLLPGDADYKSIPAVLRHVRFNAMVASHHGSRLESIALVPASRSRGILVYSYGSGNSFGHPRLHTQLEYLDGGWRPENTLATTQSIRKRPCNIGIALTPESPSVGCGICGPRFTATL